MTKPRNEFDKFSDLPIDLQREALREGEMRLQAQLAVAMSADQRALAWGGLLVTLATASIGTALAVVSQNPADFSLAFFASAFGGAIGFAAQEALSTMKPALFCMPGNSPDAWLPDQWECKGSDEEKAQAARRDQAEQLTRFIADNAKSAKARAASMNASYALTGNTVFLAFFVLVGLLAFRLSVT